MNMGERAIAEVNWASFEVLRGTGSDLANALARLLRSEDSAAAEIVWNDLENVVFAQDTVYGAAEPTMTVLFAALADDPPAHVRDWIVELMFFLVKGGSLDDPGLSERCHAEARKGLWLLGRQARVGEGNARRAVIDVIRVVDAAMAQTMAKLLGDEVDEA